MGGTREPARVLTLFVDGLLMAGRGKEFLDMLKRKLMVKSEVADLGNVF